MRLRWRHRLGPVADRRAARAAGFDRPRGIGPLSDQPARTHRPGHRRADPPLRARRPRLADPRRRHRVRQHSRRRRLAFRRKATRRLQRLGDRCPHRRTPLRHPRTVAGQSVRAHCDRRERPRRLRRDVPSISDHLRGAVRALPGQAQSSNGPRGRRALVRNTATVVSRGQAHRFERHLQLLSTRPGSQVHPRSRRAVPPNPARPASAPVRVHVVVTA